MGIPSYFAYIIRNHKKIIGKLDTINNPKRRETYTPIHNLYLDCNSIIYDSLRDHELTNIAIYEKLVIKSVCEKILNYINTIKPTQNIFIAFDGIPPVAKLAQQKNRRYKAWYQNNLFNVTDKWNTANITPGTEFMDLLNSEINKFFSKGASSLGVKNLIISCSDEAGEGEHKLYNYIRNNPDQHKDMNTVIYGLDADLIMLSLNHLQFCKNIYLYREAPHFISSLDNSLSADEHYLLNMSLFRKELHNLMMNHFEIEKGADECITDYIFVCFLLGNDFMPHFPALNIRHDGIDLLLQLYKMLFGNNNKTLVKDGKICWRNLKVFIKHIGDNEEELLLNIYKIREKMEKKKWSEATLEEKIDKFTNIPTQSRNIEHFINPNENGWRWRYYKSIFNIDINSDVNRDDIWLKQLSINFLETLEWTYTYYTNGCTDWHFCYNYSYPPLFQDLVNFIPYFDNEILDKKTNPPLNINTTLAYVLPKNSLHLLKSDIAKKLLTDFSEYYRDDYEFNWAFCRYFWECHVNFPNIDIHEFDKVVKSITS